MDRFIMFKLNVEDELTARNLVTRDRLSKSDRIDIMYIMDIDTRRF